MYLSICCNFYELENPWSETESFRSEFEVKYGSILQQTSETEATIFLFINDKFDVYIAVIWLSLSCFYKAFV